MCGNRQLNFERNCERPGVFKCFRNLLHNFFGKMCKKNKNCAIKCAIKPGDELGADGDRSLWTRPGMFRMPNGEYIRTPSIRDLLSRVIELIEKGARSKCCVTCAYAGYCGDTTDTRCCTEGRYDHTKMTLLDKCESYEPRAGLETDADRFKYLAIALWPTVYVDADGRELRRVVIKGLTLGATNTTVHHKIVQ